MRGSCTLGSSRSVRVVTIRARGNFAAQGGQALALDRAQTVGQKSLLMKRATALATAFVLSLAGCAHVAPYDRGKLAEPSMSPSDVTGAAEAHVHAVHEGAAGGAHGESGCGCN